jgi:iron-sulfur cluster assembly protein
MGQMRGEPERTKQAMSSQPTTDGKSTEQAAETPTNEEAPKLVAKERARAAQEGSDIHLTPEAAGKIKSLIETEGYPDTMYLYVGVKGGGCSGLQYVLDLRDEVHSPVNEMDEVFESNGITVVCDFKSYMVGNLSGTTIDYKETVMAAGFTFNNPNAKHSCGCGSSYSA